MAEYDYDVIIIGSGPGGEGAAMMLAKSGKRVAVVEYQKEVGGACTHWATIPSKALRHVVEQLGDFKAQPVFREALRGKEFGYPHLLQSARSVIDRQSHMRMSFYERNQVDVISGWASFVDEHTIRVTVAINPDGTGKTFSAEKFILATGSRPYHPPEIDFSAAGIYDSDSILKLDYTPRSVTVYGAGVIGCEYASIFRNLDLKVNLVNTRSHLLSYLDSEIIDALSYHLRDQGVVIRHNEEFDHVVNRDQSADGQVELHLKSGKVIKSDLLLWTNGRSGNSDRMNLDKIGLEIDHRGNLAVNSDYQTTLKHIYAVGDLVGMPALASTSYAQGRYAASHVLSGKGDHRLVEHLPVGIYTLPEISCIGATEQELTEKRTPYEVGRAFFRHLARAQITGCTTGMLKILFHRESLEILGIHCFGSQASEILHIGQVVMSQPGKANNVRFFIENTFNYPTMAEAYRVAAFNGLNRL